MLPPIKVSDVSSFIMQGDYFLHIVISLFLSGFVSNQGNKDDSTIYTIFVCTLLAKDFNLDIKD